MTEEQNFFDKFGLEVTTGEVEVGKTYPIYGMITSIVNELPGEVEVELNYNIKAKMNISDVKHIEKLKERSFEPGIFISKIVDNADTIVVECSTVIFGKKQWDQEN